MFNDTGLSASWSAVGYRKRTSRSLAGTGAIGAASVDDSSLCTSGIPSSRAITRDSAHHPIRLTMVMESTEMPKNR